LETNRHQRIEQKIKSTNEKQHFIDYLPKDITEKEMAAIDAEFNFTQGGNFVVKRQWFVIAIRQQYQPAYSAIEQFMIATSRTGSLQTLYKEMIKTPEGKTWAKSIFEKAKSGYHLTTVQDLQRTIN
jgi:leukotriene-A4 hydrolase